MQKWIRIVSLIVAFVIPAGLVTLAVLTARLRIPGEEIVPAGCRRNQALYVKMRDGVEIAVDIWLPPDLQKDERVPVLLRTTRYWRAEQPLWGARLLMALRQMPVGQFLTDRDLHLAGRRFAVVLADARGSGASGGSRISEFSADEISDLGELVDWAVRQPWSDGRIGTYGASYEGTTAELTAVSKPRGLRAVVPLFATFDLESVTWPGGVYSRLVADWSTSVSALDRNDVCGVYEVGGWHCFLKRLVSGGVKPVDTDTRGEHLAELIVQRHNENPAEAQRNLEFWDDEFNTSRGNMHVDELSAYGHRKEIEDSGVVMQVWCGWLDSQLCENSLERFKTFHNPQELIIAPLSHGGFYNIDPFASKHVPPVPSMDEQDSQLADFFDRVLRTDLPSKIESKIRYYTMGENKWHETTVWPPEGFFQQRYFLGENHTLAYGPSADGSDTYTVDFTASTGGSSRWHTSNGGGDVTYPDRSAEDKKLLTYASRPLETDVEITGSPLISLEMSSTTRDGAIHAYLEDISPQQQVTYLDEGIFRVIHRKLANPKTLPYVQLGPPHSFLRKDAEPLEPGKSAVIEFGFYPTSVLLRKGHRIRLALAGADVGMFHRYPTEGTSTWTVLLGQGHASYLDIPMKTR